MPKNFKLALPSICMMVKRGKSVSFLYSCNVHLAYVVMYFVCVFTGSRQL